MSSADDFIINRGVLEKYTGNSSAVVIPDGVTSIRKEAFFTPTEEEEFVEFGPVTDEDDDKPDPDRPETLIEKITIPKSLEDIEADVFENCKRLREVHISDISAWCSISFENITSNPLVYAGMLYIDGRPAKDIVIPHGTKEVPDYAFYHYRWLESITLPDSVTFIGDHSFEGCKELRSVTVPDSVTDIGEEAFCGCDKLDEITVPDSVTYIGKNAFTGTAYYKNRANREKGMLYIGNHLIEGNMRHNAAYTVRSGTVHIANGAFGSCKKLKSIIIADSVTVIGDEAFCNCSSLTSAVLPKSLKNIGSRAFRDCAGLTSIVIPDGTVSIDFEAFRGCSGLTSVIIPKSVIEIGKRAFYCGENMLLYFENRKFDDIPRYYRGMSAILGFAAFCRKTEPADEIINSYIDLLKESICAMDLNRIISEKALFRFILKYSVITTEEAEVLLSIMPENNCVEERAMLIEYINNHDNPIDTLSIDRIPLVTTFRDWGFRKNDDGTAVLTAYHGDEDDVICPAQFCGRKVTEIGPKAFKGFHSITSIRLPEDTVKIGENAFKLCTMLSSINIPETVTDIGQDAFAFCDSLTSITLPKNITVISHGLFSCCNSLAEITVPDGVTSLGDYAFEGCRRLKAITVPDSVKSMGYKAFAECSSLVSITLPDGIPFIDEEVFLNCSALKSLTIPDSVTNICDKAFFGCGALASIIVPDSVTSIGYEAFGSCTRLKTVSVNKNTAIAYNAFSDCPDISIIRR